MPQVQKNVMEKVLSEIDHLPTLPHVVAKIIAMAESDQGNAVALSKELDQSLSAKVLMVANSAYYGGNARRQVNSVHHAIVIIGFDAVKEIILTTSLFHTFKDAQDVKSLEPLWQHSVECAVAARRLAWVFRYEGMDEAYVAGLVHDIGKLVIQQYFPDQLRLIKKEDKEGADDLAMEKEILGMTHAAIAGKIAKHWNFPEPLVEAVAHHHDEGWQLNPKLGKIIFYANRFVLGRVDFFSILNLFGQSGISYSPSWKAEDLARVEDMLQGEIKKASSMLHSSSVSSVPK
jgi:putative nucleotidyltransferase with HDIG domain